MLNGAVFFNLDFIYYLIYLFFRSIFGWFTFSGGNVGTGETKIGLFSLLKYLANGKTSEGAYRLFGEGIGAKYDGYSLFTPPHGLSSFDGFFGWWNNFTTNPYCSSCPSFSDLFFGGVNGFLWIIAIIMIFAFIFLKIKMKEVEEMESIKYDTVYKKEESFRVNSSAQKKNNRWIEVLKLSKSENINDQKTAIINADNLLEETLKENGYEGNTLGEMLKNAKFDTLQNAWAAHNVRNKIAHDPTFILTPQETKRVIQNYSKVFNEFYYL